MVCRTDRVYSYLSFCALGLAFGIVDGLFMLVYGWVAYFTGNGVELVTQMGTLYCGYAPTVLGGLIGGLWGLVVGFVFGSIVAGIYNCCLCCCRKKCATTIEEDKLH